MKNKILNATLSVILFSVSCLINVANAGLIDRGNGMIYDNVKNITWLQDASLAGRSMNWSNSMAWAANLTYGGFSNWRLPTINVSTLNGGCYYSKTGGTDCGYNVLTANSELAYMFYVNLGNVSYYDTLGNSAQLGWNTLNTSFIDAATNNTVSFINLKPIYYWSGTEYARSTNNAWFFLASFGLQDFNFKSYNMYAWAVRDGDVGAVTSSVPEPGTLAIFGLGLLGLISRKRLIIRKRQG